MNISLTNIAKYDTIGTVRLKALCLPLPLGTLNWCLFYWAKLDKKEVLNMAHKMTPKRIKFCDEYIKTGNKTEAYVRAFSTKKRRAAEANARKLLAIPVVADYVAKKMDEITSKKIATAEETLEYLTTVMRGESESEVVVVELKGDGTSEARTVKKRPDEKEKLKAAELLGRRYRLYTDKVEVDTKTTVIFDDEEKLED